MNFLSACSHVTKIGGIRKKKNKSQKPKYHINRMETLFSC